MDMFETVAEIEAICVRMATYRMTPLERSHLMELHESSQAMIDRGDFDAYDRFNLEFHDAICSATHNAFLAEQAIAVRTRLNAFRRTQLRHGERMQRSRDEHEAIMQAILAHDSERAHATMRDHVNLLGDNLLDFLAAFE